MDAHMVGRPSLSLGFVLMCADTRGVQIGGVRRGTADGGRWVRVGLEWKGQLTRTSTGSLGRQVALAVE